MFFHLNSRSVNMGYEKDKKAHDLSMVVSKMVLTDLYGPFSISIVLLILFAFLSRRHGG